MITFEDAVRIARRTLEHDLPTAIPLQLIPEHTIEKPYGWVFFYSSSLFIQTGEFRYAVAGNAPFLVLKSDGRVVILGTAAPTEWYLDQYEKGELQ